MRCWIFVALRVVAAELTRRATMFFSRRCDGCSAPLPSSPLPVCLRALPVRAEAALFSTAKIFHRRSVIFTAGTTPGSPRKTFWMAVCWKPSRAVREILDQASEARSLKKNEVTALASHSRTCGTTPTRPKVKMTPPTMHQRHLTATARALRQTPPYLHHTVLHQCYHLVHQRRKTAPQQRLRRAFRRPHHNLRHRHSSKLLHPSPLP